MADFNDVYKRYFRDVYHYAFSLCKNEALAEEITQETFFKALKKIDEFRGDCSVRVWLCQIAKNTYYSYCANEKRRSEHIEEDITYKAVNIPVEEKIYTASEYDELWKGFEFIDRS